MKTFFSRRAKKQESLIGLDDIARHPAVRKAVLRDHSRKLRRRVLAPLLATTMLVPAISAVTLYNPDLVSKPVDAFMAEKGHPADFSQHFSAQNIRVYDRQSRLFPVHVAGHISVNVWHETARQPALTRAFYTASSYVQGFLNGLRLKNNPTQTDPVIYRSLVPDGPLKTSFIVPPAEDFALGPFMQQYALLPAGMSLKFSGDVKKLQDTVYQIIILHEMRHADQDIGKPVPLNEADADKHSFHVLHARRTDPALLDESATLVMHARTTSAVITGRSSHAISRALTRRLNSFGLMLDDTHGFSHLHGALSSVITLNQAAFRDMPAATQFLHAGLALENDGYFEHYSHLKPAWHSYKDAVAFFDGTAETGRIFNPDFDYKTVNTALLNHAHYQPVAPDLVQPKAERKPPAPQQPKAGS